MNKKKKIFVSSALSMLVLASSVTPLLANKEITTRDFLALREQAERTSKKIDVAAYEREMEAAKTPKEQLAVSKKFQKYAITSTVKYYDENTKYPSMKASSRAAKTRIRENTYLGGKDEFSKQYSSDLNDAAQLVLDIGMSWSHPVSGVLYTILGRMIPSDEFYTYTSIIERTLYDSLIQEKIVEVYMTSTNSWEPMAMSSKKDTNAQINTVYYHNKVRQEPSNIDCGLIKTQTGEYFNNESRLTQLAKNTTAPLSFPYSQGKTKHYKNSSIFKY